MTKKKNGYWLSVSAWNLNEIFASECISPFSFYEKRGFGNPGGRLPEPGEPAGYLSLLRDNPGHDICLYINAASLDPRFIQRTDTGLYYFKTIYFRRGNFQLNFSNERLLKLFTAGSMMMLEVKCEPKYAFRGTMSWDILRTLPEQAEMTVRQDGEEMPDAAVITRDPLLQPAADKAFNQIKGLILGMIRGLISTLGPAEQELDSSLGKLKNLIAGARTKLVVSDMPETGWDTGILEITAAAESLFAAVTGSAAPRLFEMLRLRVASADDLHIRRTGILTEQNNGAYKRQFEAEKEHFEKTGAELYALENSSGISEVFNELQKIKNAEKRQGEMMGKKRHYFTKGSDEYLRKADLKEQISAWEKQAAVTEIRARLKASEERLKSYSFGSTPYDTALDDEFSRLSEYSNELLKLSGSHFAEGRRSGTGLPDMKGLDIDIRGLREHYETGSEDYGIFLRELPETLTRKFTPAAKAVLICAFNAVLSLPAGLSQGISQHHVLSLIRMIGVEFRNTAAGTSDEDEQLAVLRDYYRYKTKNEGDFTIPENDPVIQNIMAFAIKAGGHDQIDRFVKERAVTENWISSALWGACTGFAGLPKTFTNSVYDSKNEQLLDETDDYLFTNFLNLI